MAGRVRGHSHGMDWVGLLSFGVFIAIVGVTWALTPNLTDETIRFFKDFRLQNVTENVVFPTPGNAYAHKVVYKATMQFCFVFGAFEIVVLALRFVFHESRDRKADAVSGIAFWLSVGFFLTLLIDESISWFSFVSGMIISVGLAIVASSLVKLPK